MDKPVNGVAIWNIETESWESPEGGFHGTTPTDPVYAYAFAAMGDSIFVGGKFHYAGNKPMQHIAVWDGSTWSSLGEAAGYVYDLDFDSKGNLYAVGYYPAHEANSISGIGIWNAGEVRIALFNLQGKLMKTLAEEQKIAGNNTLEFYTGDLPEGIYMIRLSQGILSESRMVVLKRR